MRILKIMASLSIVLIASLSIVWTMATHADEGRPDGAIAGIWASQDRECGLARVYVLFRHDTMHMLNDMGQGKLIGYLDKISVDETRSEVTLQTNMPQFFVFTAPRDGRMHLLRVEDRNGSHPSEANLVKNLKLTKCDLQETREMMAHNKRVFGKK
ncbi:MAG: hypothetical protein AAGF29_03105 [Pseudomonadota bacterium]